MLPSFRKLLGLAAIAILALSATSLSARPSTRSGTTLAAYKTIDICNIPLPDGNWTIFGVISVWNEGAIDTIGFTINDVIEKKVGTKWVTFAIPTILDPITEIPAGTTLATATTFRYVAEIPAGSVLVTDQIRNTANLTILNHSSSLGRPFGPSPRATWSGTFYCVQAGCTFTQGYWGNKPGVIWPLAFDRNAPFFLSGQTWQQVLDTPVNVSQGYYQLAHQYIAATLNAASGAPVPGGVQTTLDLATAWLTVNTPAACTGNGSCGLQKDWAATLDLYNNGNYPDGPSHCAE